MDRSKGCEPRLLWNAIGATSVKIADLLDSRRTESARQSLADQKWQRTAAAVRRREMSGHYVLARNKLTISSR